MTGLSHLPTVALLPWGNVLEDFLDPMGISLDTFCSEFRGSWLFGYIEALKEAGIRTVMFCVSRQVSEPTRRVHGPTGATICLLPVSPRYRRIEKHVLYPYGQTVREVFGEIRGVKTLAYPALYLIKEALLYLSTPHRLLAREIRREGCSVILCQEYEYPRFDSCVLLGKLLHLPVYATFQGGNYQHANVERLLRPITLRLSAGLVIASNQESQRIQKQYGISPDKLAQIDNPINLDQWKAVDRCAARHHLGFPEDAFVVAWHGRVSIHKKGLDVLLTAWERFLSAHSSHDLRLVLVGSGDGDESLHSLLDSMPDCGITWIDRFIHNTDELSEILSAADVFAFPSRYEGYPVALIEAMACSLPVIAARAVGAADILARGESDGGLLVPVDDPIALSRSMARLLEDEPLRRQLGTAARRSVEEHSSMQVVGEKLCSFLFRK